MDMEGVIVSKRSSGRTRTVTECGETPRTSPADSLTRAFVAAQRPRRHAPPHRGRCQGGRRTRNEQRVPRAIRGGLGRPVDDHRGRTRRLGRVEAYRCARVLSRLRLHVLSVSGSHSPRYVYHLHRATRTAHEPRICRRRASEARETVRHSTRIRRRTETENGDDRSAQS